jgi:hypothetical protein
MRIVVSDTSCMVDLRKAALLEALLRLPYSFVMPDILFADEWLCLSDDEKSSLRALGLDVRTLPGPLVERAGQTFSRHSRLKLNDCFALTLAEEIGDGILLTGDGPLRRIAEGKGLEVRGVLWVTDELETHGVLTAPALHAALQILADDGLVFLPKDEVLRRLRRHARLL